MSDSLRQHACRASLKFVMFNFVIKTKALAYRDGGEKIWYTTGTRAPEQYLISLLDSEKLFANGLDCIEHC